MYCQTHRLECREVCLEKSCTKPWRVCSKCQHHSNHRTILCADLFDSVSRISQVQNSFQSSLKTQLFQLINNQLQRTVQFLKSYIEQSICEELRRDLKIKQFGCNPEIELAVKEYQIERRFKQRSRQKLINLEFNLQYQRQVQRQMSQAQTHRIQSIFFNLLHTLKQSLNNNNNSYNNSRSNFKQDTKQSFYKTRSFSNNSANTLSSSASFQRKRKKSTMSKHNIFNEISKDKVKKIVSHNIKFVQQPVKQINRSEQFLRMMEDKIASRILNDRYKTQEPFIKEEDLFSKKQLNVIPNSIVNNPIFKPNNNGEVKQEVIVYQKRTMQIQNIKQIPSDPPIVPIALVAPVAPVAQQEVFYSSKDISKQVSTIVNKQNTKPQRPSIKSVQSSRIQSRNRSSHLKKNSKVQKRVSIVQNKAEDSFQQNIILQTKKSINHKLVQQLQARLRIVPEVNGFLKQNLLQIQQIWQAPNNVCWRMYFEIKEELQIQEAKYTDQKEMARQVTYMKKQIIEQLQYNITNTKIKTISKLRNHLILQYLVKYSAQLLILFEGANIQNTGFSAQKYLTTLSNLSQGDVKGAFAYMTSNLNKLKQLV